MKVGFCIGRGVSILSSLLLLPVIVAAQAQPKDLAGRRVAILIGVNTYKDSSFRELRFAEADVEAMATVLGEMGFEVHLLLGSSADEDSRATRSNILNTVEALADTLQPADLALVALSGHGQQIYRQEGGFESSESYFCPVDAVVDTPDKLVSLSTLVGQVLASKPGRKMVFVDACRDVPAMSRSRSTRGIEGRDVRLPEETAIYFSCRAGQQSYEHEKLGHGLFMHCVLEGLRGSAATTQGEVHWSSLVAHVDRRMQEQDLVGFMPRNLRQVPIAAGSMPFTLLRRVKPPLQSPPHVSGKLVERLTNRFGMELCLVPAAEFEMGGAADDPETLPIEKPQHSITLTRPFYVSDRKITRSQYEAVLLGKPADEDLDQQPKVHVTWLEAVAFCNHLSRLENLAPYYAIQGQQVLVQGGVGYRLPTEAEWEWAFGTGPPKLGANRSLDSSAMDAGVTGVAASPESAIATGQSNTYGIRNLHDRVGEWCWDRFGRYEAKAAVDPTGPQTGNQRVVKGGASGQPLSVVRRSARRSVAISFTADDIGFRVVRSAEVP